MTTYLFDLDFESADLTLGIPAENYRGIPLLWDEEDEYEFIGHGWENGTDAQKFGLDNRYWEIEAAREPIP